MKKMVIHQRQISRQHQIAGKPPPKIKEEARMVDNDWE